MAPAEQDDWNALRIAVDKQSEMFEDTSFRSWRSFCPTVRRCTWATACRFATWMRFRRRPPTAVFGNRGASGIDGIVSSALGASAGVAGPLVLVLGDLSFYHDVNGLLAAKLHNLNATIVVINNDGGGIFSFLPQAAHPEHFELLFGTPIGLDFEPAVRMYGGKFTRVSHWPEFREALMQGIQGDGLHVVEIVTERRRNLEQHREIIGAARAAVSEALCTEVAETGAEAGHRADTDAGADRGSEADGRC